MRMLVRLLIVSLLLAAGLLLLGIVVPPTRAVPRGAADERPQSAYNGDSRGAVAGSPCTRRSPW